MAKSVLQALIDEIHYPMSEGLVENILIRRGLPIDEEYSFEVSNSDEYRGSLADCLYSLITSISFSEADKSFGAIASDDKKRLLDKANSIYASLGEETKTDGEPRVYVGDSY